jgi:glycosyltransferase involved in cell wall biosynthesis
MAIEMGKNGRKAVLEHFNWEVESKKLIEMYENITD